MPDILTLSSSVNPETSRSALISTASSKVEMPEIEREFTLSSLKEPAPPAPGATPLMPVYLAPATYTLLPLKLTPLGKFVPIK